MEKQKNRKRNFAYPCEAYVAFLWYKISDPTSVLLKLDCMESQSPRQFCFVCFCFLASLVSDSYPVLKTLFPANKLYVAMYICAHIWGRRWPTSYDAHVMYWNAGLNKILTPESSFLLLKALGRPGWHSWAAAIHMGNLNLLPASEAIGNIWELNKPMGAHSLFLCLCLSVPLQ